MRKRSDNTEYKEERIRRIKQNDKALYRIQRIR